MRKLSVLFAAVTMFMTVGMAKAQKMASLDYEQVLSLMPETKKVSTDLENFSKSKEAELKKMGDTWQADVQKYQAEGAKLTEAQRTAKEAELQKTQQNLQQMAVTAQQDLNKRRESSLKPIIDKLNAAIAKAAKANGWDFVIDASALIYKGGPDATAAVKKELGL
ncbi:MULTISPECIES: OmpH family outer membrane protein [Chryseobacterium group]|uniref:OmpH family outer membrane protein n=1 Tax=Chryseobacterium group TaxID=2782232 RepID=UPI0012AA187A|nr:MULTISPECIES: OmpH family outer membrane protein [Chryseobacterium group]MDF0718949.1 OmpH family outer membrane protein [Kaistella sp. PBT33-4]QFG54127.1 OmpH family outer membrane protein [Chryseobacterium sp.]